MLKLKNRKDIVEQVITNFHSHPLVDNYLPPIERIVVTINKAENLKKLHSLFNDSPYVLVYSTCDVHPEREIYQTKTIKKTLNPDWNEKLEIFPYGEEDIVLLFVVMNNGKVTAIFSDEALGYTQVKIRELKSNEDIELNLPLEPSGNLHITIRVERGLMFGDNIFQTNCRASNNSTTTAASLYNKENGNNRESTKSVTSVTSLTNVISRESNTCSDEASHEGVIPSKISTLLSEEEEKLNKILLIYQGFYTKVRDFSNINFLHPTDEIKLKDFKLEGFNIGNDIYHLDIYHSSQLYDLRKLIPIREKTIHSYRNIKIGKDGKYSEEEVVVEAKTKRTLYILFVISDEEGRIVNYGEAPVDYLFASELYTEFQLTVQLSSKSTLRCNVTIERKDKNSTVKLNNECERKELIEMRQLWRGTMERFIDYSGKTKVKLYLLPKSIYFFSDGFIPEEVENGVLFHQKDVKPEKYRIYHYPYNLERTKQIMKEKIDKTQFTYSNSVALNRFKGCEDITLVCNQDLVYKAEVCNYEFKFISLVNSRVFLISSMNNIESTWIFRLMDREEVKNIRDEQEFVYLNLTLL
ncbi:hypothetical protein ABK040_008883 [Willaertia magna]